MHLPLLISWHKQPWSTQAIQTAEITHNALLEQYSSYLRKRSAWFIGGKKTAEMNLVLKIIPNGIIFKNGEFQVNAGKRSWYQGGI